MFPFTCQYSEEARDVRCQARCFGSFLAKTRPIQGNEHSSPHFLIVWHCFVFGSSGDNTLFHTLNNGAWERSEVNHSTCLKEITAYVQYERIVTAVRDKLLFTRQSLTVLEQVPAPARSWINVVGTQTVLLPSKLNSCHHCPLRTTQHLALKLHIFTLDGGVKVLHRCKVNL